MSLIMTKPIILCFSGLDPSGGAGIQADIETVQAHGCHAASIITALTVQDTKTVYGLSNVDLGVIKKQTEAIFNDMPVAAIKVGLVSNPELVTYIANLARTYQLPVIVDPVLASGDGSGLSTEQTKQNLIKAYLQDLLPLSRVVLTNTYELQTLTQDLGNSVDVLLSTGVNAVAVTGTHDDTDDVINRLYDKSGLISEKSFPRLDAEFHGTGCTLASAVAANIALGDDVKTAYEKAQVYTYEAISNANQLGKGQWMLERLT